MVGVWRSPCRLYAASVLHAGCPCAAPCNPLACLFPPPQPTSTQLPLNRNSYDASADIWSFGITMIELASGRPPLSRAHPMRVIMQTIQGPPPTLAGVLGTEAAGKFSKQMHEVVAACLDKDPTARPTPGALLQHKWFKVGGSGSCWSGLACGAAALSALAHTYLVSSPDRSSFIQPPLPSPVA